MLLLEKIYRNSNIFDLFQYEASKVVRGADQLYFLGVSGDRTSPSDSKYHSRSRS